ncbi:MAG: YihY/virulence factor BrkB family protein [Acidimicrobiales bacterium]
MPESDPTERQRSARDLRRAWQEVAGPAPEQGQGPPGITHISAKEWRGALTSVRRHVKSDRVNVAAGAFAYRWFLSLFPTVIALLAVASLLAIPATVTVKLIKGVSTALPSGASGVLTEAIGAASHRTNGSFATVVVAAVVALWSATSGMVMLEEGLDMAYEVTHDRSFLGKRLLAVPLLAGAAVLGGAASGLIVFGHQIGHAIEGASPVGGSAFSAGWTALRWVVGLVLIDLLLSFLYWLAPNARTPWRWLSPGAAVATALWALISLGFSYYTTSFGSYGKTYGAFAGVAILIFWLFLTGTAVLLGGEINAAFERQEAPGSDPDGQAAAPTQGHPPSPAGLGP